MHVFGLMKCLHIKHHFNLCSHCFWKWMRIKHRHEDTQTKRVCHDVWHSLWWGPHITTGQNSLRASSLFQKCSVHRKTKIKLKHNIKIKNYIQYKGQCDKFNFILFIHAKGQATDLQREKNVQKRLKPLYGQANRPEYLRFFNILTFDTDKQRGRRLWLL